MLETGINEAKKISEDRMIKLLKFSLGENSTIFRRS